jgi:hypothetical protein
MILSKLHQSRWDAAKKLFQSIKDKAKKRGYLIHYCGNFIKPEQIVIGVNDIRINIEDTVYEIFYANPDYDHGLCDTIKMFRDRTKLDFKLVIFKEI